MTTLRTYIYAPVDDYMSTALIIPTHIHSSSINELRTILKEKEMRRLIKFSTRLDAKLYWKNECNYWN